jgi:hypothetical protein
VKFFSIYHPETKIQDGHHIRISRSQIAPEIKRNLLLCIPMGGYFRNKSGQALRDTLLLAYRRVCVQRETCVFVSWCRIIKWGEDVRRQHIHMCRVDRRADASLLTHRRVGVQRETCVFVSWCRIMKWGKDVRWQHIHVCVDRRADAFLLTHRRVCVQRETCVIVTWCRIMKWGEDVRWRQHLTSCLPAGNLNCLLTFYGHSC